MRNLNEHPVTVGEIERCLNELADQLEAERPRRMGDMRPTLLRAAAKIVVRTGFAMSAIDPQAPRR